MKKAVIYSRVSTFEQDYTSQTAELVREAERMGYEVTQIYEEKESGFVDDRPELAKVLALTKADTDAVFVWEISRLSRRTVMVLSAVEEIEKKGVLIYAKNENYKSWNENGKKDSTSKLVLTLYASIAEAEATKFKERSRRGKRYKVLVEKKAYAYNFVYGYKKDSEGRLVINEEEAAIVRDIFEKANEGYSTVRLRMYLKSQYGFTFSGSSLNRLLKNPVYMGRKPLGTKRYTKKDLKKIEAGTKVRFYNPEVDIIDTPAIITAELFDSVQRGLESRKTRSYAKENRKPSLLKGLVLCGRCNSIYTNTGQVYTCCSKTSEKRDYCGSTAVATKALENCVWYVTKEVFSEAIAKEIADRKAEPIMAEIAQLQKEIEGYEGTIKQHTKEISNLLTVASKVGATDQLVERITQIQKQQQTVETEIADRKAKIALLQKRLDSPTEAVDITEEDEKFEYLHKVIEGVFVYGDFFNKMLVIQYLNGITVFCIRKYRKWFWFYDKGDLVVADAVALQEKSPIDLKLKDSIYIDVTDSNNAYCSGEGDEVIFGQYTAEAFFTAMQKNKQLKEVKTEETK